MRWFGGGEPKRPSPVDNLTDAIERLQNGIVTNLTAEYSIRVPAPRALSMATCTLSYAMAIEPIGDEAQRFYAENAEVVLAEARALADNDRVSQALSYLYAGLTLLIAIKTQNPFSEAAVQLGERATSLAIYVPNTDDICGSGDAVSCIAALHSYAEAYLADSFVPQPNK